jgi:predicted nucleic-acid-binding Zn-ribbon protein
MNEAHQQALKRYLTKLAKKAGKVKTAKKAAAARINGTKPCRPGRFRGRPPKRISDKCGKCGLELLREKEITDRLAMDQWLAWKCAKCGHKNTLRGRLDLYGVRNTVPTA